MPRMYSNGTGGGGSGTGVTIYTNLSDLPVSATDGVVVSVLETRKLYTYDLSRGKWVVVGGEGALIGRANQSAIPDATQTFAVAFADAMPSSTYSLMATIRNTVDADPIWLQIVETIKSASGFTVKFNAPTDSANYVLEWAVSENAVSVYP